MINIVVLVNRKACGKGVPVYDQQVRNWIGSKNLAKLLLIQWLYSGVSESVEKHSCIQYNCKLPDMRKVITTWNNWKQLQHMYFYFHCVLAKFCAQYINPIENCNVYYECTIEYILPHPLKLTLHRLKAAWLEYSSSGSKSQNIFKNCNPPPSQKLKQN